MPPSIKASQDFITIEGKNWVHCREAARQLGIGWSQINLLAKGMVSIKHKGLRYILQEELDERLERQRISGIRNV